MIKDKEEYEKNKKELIEEFAKGRDLAKYEKENISDFIDYLYDNFMQIKRVSILDT